MTQETFEAEAERARGSPRRKAAPEPAPPPPPVEAAPRRARRGLGWLVVLLLAAGAAALIWNYSGLLRTQWTALPAAPPPPAVTIAKPLVKEIVEWKEFTGQFVAVDSVDVRARVSGYLE